VSLQIFFVPVVFLLHIEKSSGIGKIPELKTGLNVENVIKGCTSGCSYILYTYFDRKWMLHINSQGLEILMLIRDKKNK
jgi:hypothetical protein